MWEDKPEDVVTECKNKLPVLKEVEDKAILKNSEPEQPTHIIIEGDNYHSLSVLNYTHKGKIDVIYIDPPYNTGNQDFKYNDCFVDKEDSFRHSKWLSFMEKRLVLAKELLSESGVIFISIDDNEQAHLRLLCDEVFGEKNFVNSLIWEKKVRPSNKNKNGFSKITEYILFYKNTPEDFQVKDDPQNEEYVEKIYKNPDNDYRGVWRTKPLWSESNKNKRKILTLPNGEKIEAKWFIAQDKLDLLFLEDRIYESSNGTLSEKLFLSDGKNPMNLLYAKIAETTEHATKQLKTIFKSEKNIFDNPKPITLIKYLINKISKENSIILDFFAGSGTTGHAVLELNKEDKGNRKFILCTNNEVGLTNEDIFCKENDIKHKDLKEWKNKKEWLDWCEKHGICTTVTYPRIKKVIEGYADKEGIPANVRYFKTDFVEKKEKGNISDEDRINLTLKAGAMIALKENIFEQKEINDWWQIFENNEKILAIYFKESKAKIKNLLKKIDNKKCVLYIFSWGKNEYAEEFIAENILIKDIPEPILKIYKQINGVKK